MQYGRRGAGFGAGATAAAAALAGLGALLGACAAGTPAAAGGAGAGDVRLGVDVLAARDMAPLAGKRVGLITNHTGMDRTGRATIDVLHEHPAVTLGALFGPEHGLRGDAEAGERVDHSRDARTGLPIHSLYGETRKPTPEMMAGLDALVFDIQDIGTRYYTYIWTMAHAMEAAAEAGLEFVVLDRPNPIGGRMDGNLVHPDQRTFVGLYPVPMRHGLTTGEMARFVNAVHGIGARLTVVPVEGWSRDVWFDGTGLPWTPPSPNMPTVEAAAHYPGTCLFEGTNLSVGRGTPAAFEQIGAPWLDHEELARRLNAYGFPGLQVEAVTFTPRNAGDGKYSGELVRGVRYRVTDRAAYDPAVAGIATVVEIQRLHPELLTWREGHFDRLAGTTRVRTQVLAGASVEQITAGWAEQVAAYRRAVQPYLLY
jgi:uncharacterized protein YbbC (DUF1343 family)